jgi:membrane associated rhomboid family serine protease
VVNYALILANVLVFLFELTMSARGLDRFIGDWGANSTAVLAAIADPLAPASYHAWLTLITSQFLHAGWLHIIGNMLFLWIFGDNVEDVLGHIGYLLFYLIGGTAAGLAQAFVLGPSNIPSIGASGAIAGVLGAYIVLYPTNRVTVLIPLFVFITTAQIPAWAMIGWWFVQQFFYGVATITTATAATGGVGWWAHIGGFITGAIIILPFRGLRRRPRVTRYYPPDDYWNR